MSTYTAQTAAAEFVDAMSEDDILSFVPAVWRSGVSDMLIGEAEHLDLDEVLEAMEAIVIELRGERFDGIVKAVRSRLSSETRYTIEARPESRDFLVTVEIAADEDYDDHAEDAALIEAGLTLVDSGEEDGRVWSVWTL